MSEAALARRLEFGWRLAAISGTGSIDKIMHDTPQIVTRSATAAPFINLDACNIKVFRAGRDTIPLQRQPMIRRHSTNTPEVDLEAGTI